MNFSRIKPHASIFLLAPYVVWMALMTLLPQTAWAYAVRSGATALVLACALLMLARQGLKATFSWRAVLYGLGAGLVVFVLWIAPETWFGVGKALSASESPYAPEVCGWPLTLVKLAGSAFVIAVAEEMFFRRWLVDFAGFWWMVALFAVEHGDRWAVGAATGIIYGLLARRWGLTSSVVAHVTTNFVLGAYVVLRGVWQFW